MLRRWDKTKRTVLRAQATFEMARQQETPKTIVPGASQTVVISEDEETTKLNTCQLLVWNLIVLLRVGPTY